MSHFRGEDPNHVVSVQLKSTDAATTANYGVVFIADRSYEVVEMSETHATASSDTTPPTLALELLAKGVAKGSGTVISVGTINLHATADTPQTVACKNTVIARGQRLSLKQTTTPTALAGVEVTIVLRPV